MHSVEVLRLALALVPVLLFLAVLRGLDSYKLVSSGTVLTALAAGALAAALCFIINAFIFRQFPGYQDQYARFGAPLVEESAKAVYWIFLIATARVAFMADSAICGFAVGAGFALIENLSYLQLLTRNDMGIWILRGFGTAVMHGGVAALGAVISAYLLESRQWRAPFYPRPADGSCASLFVQSKCAVSRSIDAGGGSGPSVDLWRRVLLQRTVPAAMAGGKDGPRHKRSQYD
jgi:RsiW-degrading membrane proteinase PrsW (M82 family)